MHKRDNHFCAFFMLTNLEIYNIIFECRIYGARLFTTERRKDNMRDFEFFWENLMEYRKQFGNVNVPQKYVIGDYHLGRRVGYLRQKKAFLPQYQVEMLNSVGFVWKLHAKNPIQSFTEVCDMLEVFKKEHGHLDVPSCYTTNNGIKLGAIVNNIRTGSRYTTEEEESILNTMGFIWVSNGGAHFEQFYARLCEYKINFGDLNVPQSYYDVNGFHLGRSVAYIRKKYREGKLTPMQIQRLGKIGFSWKSCKDTSFEEAYAELVEYKEKYGSVKVPNAYVTKSGIHLGNVLYRFRYGVRGMTKKEKEKFEKLGVELIRPKIIM